MYRRSFLQGATTLALAQMLIGCSGNKQTTLRVQLLKGSIPGQVVEQFRRNLEKEVNLNFAPVEQLQSLFEELQSWYNQSQANHQQEWSFNLPFGSSEKPNIADLVTLGDYWLKTSIEKKLIQPLEVEQLKQWAVLPQRWRELVTRNEQGFLDAQGKVWAAPYRWGSTVIVYRRDKFQQLGWTPTDWSDLWRTELRDRISLLDHPREVIGLVLKKLGKSYNTENLDAIPGLEAELRALNQQVKFYDSTKYLEPLIIGDTWLAVGWSDDVLPVVTRYPQLAVVTPLSGTALWADVWVKPTGINQANLAYKWIDFCWQPNIAEQIFILTKTNSPIPTNIQASGIQEQLRNFLLNNDEILVKSEFLQPFPLAVAAQYKSIFAKIKS
ncbi:MULTISPECIES: extracellular solute-binding protein [Fischerella]|uniref:Polyamine ABC transporter substrate-binding protein n=1 Tax=Fischerella muscicola CCMEE 5323 TaxID=2019572 RepID=A0A2N6JVX2_FISMU|nr:MULTISPECIES: extracellular solute-binding protein [Fischerella]MBD2432447.1 extracellular solute-binding protein [Fischerella sp. FACHB-380]PLZ83885.1 polyamine ABC transporter substrate-binding protein [Fischerella muscicola CCMEE 5323]